MDGMRSQRRKQTGGQGDRGGLPAASVDSSQFRGTRRQILRQIACGWGGFAMAGALAAMAEESSASSEKTGTERPAGTHFTPRAKRVIFLFMHGGPSQVDTFDYKPRLQRDNGGELPFAPAANIDAKPVLMASPWKFSRRGESGLWCSELFPQLGGLMDELCVIRSLHSRGQSHGQAVSMLHTGSDNLLRPSVGAWISFGLGAENDDLPAFVSLGPSAGHGGPRNYGSAFLPAIHQATTIGRQGKLGKGTIDFLETSSGTRTSQRRQLDLIQSLNRRQLERVGSDSEIEGTIGAFELAHRMQQAAPQVMDLGKESTVTQALYGLDQPETREFGRQCLLARRLVESGVRFVELSTGNVWDQHGGLEAGHAKNARAVDRPIAGLLIDLKRRGLLDETLVVWGGEFGRTPIVQGKDGRDHNPQGFTMWLAGGGVRGGMAYGETDEFGYYAVQDRVHMHDLHATILHLLGLDHTRLTYPYAGRDFRLTDVHGRIVEPILA